MVDVAGALSEVFAEWAVRTRAPAIAWGVVRDGALEVSGGVGTLVVGETRPPDAQSVFRIASMTKSFTGAALMMLVVDGAVRLDEPVATYVPELAGWRGPTSDGPPLTVRHLVSHESGLPSDDPWADRSMDLSSAQMDEVIASGAMFAFTPGTRFEYSNLAWGLVGRVIERVAGVRPQELVSSALLEPLGMASTTWTRPSAGDVAEPYRLRDGESEHEGVPVGDGELAPMGGLWSTVADLARWVSFFLDAWPPREGVDAGPLPRWARREMQQIRRLATLERVRHAPSGPSRFAADGYGIGLASRLDERLGASVGHSGGLPGYGSHMRWLPDRGIGVIALANVTYGRMSSACAHALEVLADLDALGPETSVAPSPALADAARSAARLLTTWSDDAAESVFADTMAGDETFERRAEEARRVVERHGPLEVAELTAETPLAGSFLAAGGAVKVELGLQHGGRIQWLDVTDRTEPDDAPIVADPRVLATLTGTGCVIVRPCGDLADSFDRWQGEVLDRIGGREVVAPSAHVTLKTLGSASSPLTPRDWDGLSAAVARWAPTMEPLELRPQRLDVLGDDEERSVVIRLERTPSVARALSELRDAALAADLPSGTDDDIAAEDWIPHLTLASARGLEAAGWEQLLAWIPTAAVDGGCSGALVEVVVFDGGPGRCLVRVPLGGLGR